MKFGRCGHSRRGRTVLQSSGHSSCWVQPVALTASKEPSALFSSGLSLLNELRQQLERLFYSQGIC